MEKELLQKVSIFFESHIVLLSDQALGTLHTSKKKHAYVRKSVYMLTFLVYQY